MPGTFNRKIIASVPVLFACAAQPALAQTPPPPTPRANQLTHDIRQRKSPDARSKAWSQVPQLLHGTETDQLDALVTITRTADMRLDRTALAPEILPLLDSKSPAVRRTALTALPATRPDPKCLDAVAALAKDPDPTVRATVMSSYVFIRQPAHLDTPITEPALTLLADPQKDVVVETARSLWGVPLSPAVEAKVIQLSQFPAGTVPGFRSIPYWMNYFILSTRPQLSEPVAQRLAEIAANPDLDTNWTGRAVWGLAHPASPQAADTVTQALISELDNSNTEYHREWAVRGLAALHSDAAIKKLAEIANGDDPDPIRQLAASAAARAK